MRDLADLFHEGDADGDKYLTVDELQMHCTNPRFCAYLNNHSLDATDATALFEMLDQDGTGTVDVEEFVLGALKLKGPARCLDMIRTWGAFQNLNRQLDSMNRKITAIAERRK